MKPSLLPLLLVCALGLTGCGRFFDKFGRLDRSGLTTVTIGRDTSPLRQGVIGFQSPLEMITSLSGGLIVYATNTGSGQVFSESLNSVNGDFGSLSMLLPNGNYEFTAVGWPTANLTGAPTPSVRVRCVNGPSKTLAGGSDSVTIDLRNLDECYDDPDFAETFAKGSGPYKSLLALNLVFCNQFTNITGKSDASSCSNHESSGAFFNGDLNYTKAERVTYLSGTNSIFFTATHNSQLSSGYPTKPYELYKYDLDTGVQTKIGLSISAGFGITQLEAVPGENKVLFVRDQDTASTIARELWLYDDDLETLTMLSQSTGVPGDADGVREYRISEGGDHVVFVGDMESSSLFELYSVPLSGSSYPNPVKISGTLTGTGVGTCGSCGDGHNFYFNISPGTSDNYVLFSGENSGSDGTSNGVPGRFDLRIARVDGSDFDGVDVHGTSFGNDFPGGFRISKVSAGEIQAAGDEAKEIGFSHDGSRVLFHAKTGGGTVDKIFHLSVSHTASALLVGDWQEVISANAAHPYFVMGHTGTSTKKALVFAKDSANSYQPVVSSIDLMNPANVYPQFRFDINSGNFGQVYLTENDGSVVVAAKDTTDQKPKEIRSAAITLSNWGGGVSPLGTSVSHNTGGTPMSIGRWVNPIEGGDGDSNRVFTVNDTETTIMFASSESAANVYQLYASTIGSAGNTRLTHTDLTLAGQSVTGASFAPNGDKYFTADLDGSGYPELYKVDLTKPNLREPMGSDTYLSNAISVVPRHDKDLEGFPDVIPVMAGPKYVPGVKELWLFDPYDSTFERVSTLAGSHSIDSNKGAGRARVRIMKNRYDTGEAVAFESDCLSLTANNQDGNWIMSDVRVPTGLAGASSPFRTVVDVFPGATNCNGGFRRHSFPNGLADYSAAQGADAKLAGDGMIDLLLFVRDP